MNALKSLVGRKSSKDLHEEGNSARSPRSSRSNKRSSFGHHASQADGAVASLPYQETSGGPAPDHGSLPLRGNGTHSWRKSSSRTRVPTDPANLSHNDSVPPNSPAAAAAASTAMGFQSVHPEPTSSTPQALPSTSNNRNRNSSGASARLPIADQFASESYYSAPNSPIKNGFNSNSNNNNNVSSTATNGHQYSSQVPMPHNEIIQPKRSKVPYQPDNVPNHDKVLNTMTSDLSTNAVHRKTTSRDISTSENRQSHNNADLLSRKSNEVSRTHPALRTSTGPEDLPPLHTKQDTRSLSETRRKPVGSPPSEMSPTIKTAGQQQTYEGKDMLITGAPNAPPLEGLIRLGKSEKTTVHRTWAKPVYHESVHPTIHHVHEESIQRDIHNHDVYHRILPVVDVQVLPTKHYVADERSGELQEIDGRHLPGRLGSWVVAETVSKLHQDAHAKTGSREFTARTFANGEGDAKQYISGDGTPTTENTWIHKPVLSNGAMHAGAGEVVHFGNNASHHPDGSLNTSGATSSRAGAGQTSVNSGAANNEYTQQHFHETNAEAVVAAAKRAAGIHDAPTRSADYPIITGKSAFQQERDSGAAIAAHRAAESSVTSL